MVGWPPGGSAGTSFCSGTEISISRLAMVVPRGFLLFSADASSLGRSCARLFQDPDIFDEKFDDMPDEFKSTGNGRVKPAAAAGRSNGNAEYPKAGSDGHKFRRSVTRSFGLFQLCRSEQGICHKRRGVGDPGIAGYHRCHDGAVHQKCELMGKHYRLSRTHVAGELLDIRQDDFLVPHRDGAKLLLILVMFAVGIDEGAAIETFLAKPILQRRKNPREFCLGTASVGFDRIDEPVAPLLALGLQHHVHQIGFRSKQFVERGLRGAGFVDDGVNAGRVYSILAEQVCRGAEQTPARGLVIAASETYSDGSLLRM